MPELPEVETTRRGIAPFITGRIMEGVVVRNPRLRWPVAPDLEACLRQMRIHSVGRRGKYLLLETANGSLIIHLGMSGSLRLARPDDAPGPFDHVDVVLEGDWRLRLRDPRRFGCLIWSREPAHHALLRHLGPEPLDQDPGVHLYQCSRGRKRAVRDFLLDGRVLAGIGNIYANEALFRAGIDPRRPAGRIARNRYERLGTSLQATLQEAIAAGGTTLRDFVGGSGHPGYFQQALRVYARKGEPCVQCNAAVRGALWGQRSLFYCPNCQH